MVPHGQSRHPEFFVDRRIHIATCEEKVGVRQEVMGLANVLGAKGTRNYLEMWSPTTG
jgi:hypothetical protein